MWCEGDTRSTMHAQAQSPQTHLCTRAQRRLFPGNPKSETVIVAFGLERMDSMRRRGGHVGWVLHVIHCILAAPVFLTACVSLPHHRTARYNPQTLCFPGCKQSVPTSTRRLHPNYLLRTSQGNRLTNSGLNWSAQLAPRRGTGNNNSTSNIK